MEAPTARRLPRPRTGALWPGRGRATRPDGRTPGGWCRTLSRAPAFVSQVPDPVPVGLLEPLHEPVSPERTVGQPERRPPGPLLLQVAPERVSHEGPERHLPLLGKLLRSSEKGIGQIERGPHMPQHIHEYA